jgi:TPR repeat protein
MKASWKIAALVACIVATCGTAVSWQVHKAKVRERLVEEARAVRARAEQGDATAETSLGRMYYLGEGVPRDYSEAMRWCRKAADQGGAHAQYDVGYLYELGHGVPQDYAEALRWYHKAADQGEAWGQASIGEMYYNGRGVEQDRAVAASWYRQAADRGLAKAQYDLGYMYYYGQGVPQDLTEADRWYHKAADQGYKNAQRALGLRRNGLSIFGAIILAALFSWCLWILKDSVLSGWSPRDRGQRRLALTGLFGLTYVGLRLYRFFGVFHSGLAANIFQFFECLVVGILISNGGYFFPAKRPKVLLGLSCVLFFGVNLLAIARPDFWHRARPVQGLVSVDGLLLGISIPVAIFLWRDRAGRIENRDRGATASEGPAEDDLI